MNLRLLGRTLFVGAMLLALTGCFEVRQKLTVYDDGEADLMLTVVIRQDLADWSSDEDEHSAECESNFGFDDELPPSLTRTTSVRIDEGDVLCDMMVSGPLDDMIPVLEAYNEDEGDDDFILIQRLGDGRYTLVGQYDFRDDAMDFDGEDSGLGRAIRGALMATLDGAAISWEVAAPVIVETNGVENANGVVEWSFPLTDAVTTGGVYTFEVIFEVEPQSRFF